MVIELNEMSYHRNEAIDKCFDLGKLFLEHFLKVVKEGKDSRDFSHHCQEMQSWWERVDSIYLKPRNKKLNADQLINWFFLKGSSTEYLIKDDDDARLYEMLFLKLIYSDNTVKDILEELL